MFERKNLNRLISKLMLTH